jgi:hypothetical protein
MLKPIAARFVGFHPFEPSPDLLFPCSWCGDSEKGPCRRRNWATCYLALASQCRPVGQGAILNPGEFATPVERPRSLASHASVVTVKYRRTSIQCRCMLCQFTERWSCCMKTLSFVGASSILLVFVALVREQDKAPRASPSSLLGR